MLNTEHVQPGALNSEGDPLRIAHEDGGDSVTVVDRLQAGRGTYLIVVNDAGEHSLLPEATAVEFYNAEQAPDLNAEENERLRQRVAELEAQQQREPDTGPEPDRDPPDPDVGVQQPGV